MRYVLKIPGLLKKRPLAPAPPGTVPGTLTVDPTAANPKINLIAYGPEELIEKQDVDVGEVREMLGKHPVLWVNVDGLGDADVFVALGDLFRLHPLALEDVLNVNHRPKLEQYDDQLFIITRMARLEERFDQLLIHGILHLFGFDHEKTDKETKKMEAKEKELKRLLIS